MDQIQIREANGEVLIFLDRHMGDRLNALEEAAKILGREVLRERTRVANSSSRKLDDNKLQTS